MKKDYRKEIHELFEQRRREIVVIGIVQIRLLEMLEKQEERALKDNSKEAVDEIKAMLVRQKQKVFVLPHAGKRIEIKKNGTIDIRQL